ncbi:MAG: response regulator [Elusimicrobia bacterium]|nr:response regulator [Elusimicrobiota bacterium]
MPAKTYTTYEIARFCDVYPSSVIHWIDAGKLKAYSTPGGHHRVMREDLLAFLAEFRIPLPEELRSGPKRVLIVDDDAEVTRMIEKAFARQPERFQTEVCHNGVDALIRIGKSPPDLVVLDIVLPKMDGLEVCSIMRSKPETRGVKVIAITGKRLSLTEARLRERGIDAFFAKPLDLSALLAKASELAGVAVQAGGRASRPHSGKALAAGDESGTVGRGTGPAARM